MSNLWSHIRVTPGSIDGARLPTPLAGSAPHLRPQNLAQNFVRLAASATAPWDVMLRAEPALVVAQILAFHIADEMQRFDLAQETGVAAAAQEVRRLAIVVDDWLARLRQQWPKPFADVLAGLDQQMDLSDRARNLARTSAPRLLGMMQQKGFMPAATGDVLVQARAQKSGLSAAHRQMVHAIASLKPGANLAFEDRLKSGAMDPAIGLIIAELTAAQAVDAHLNQFTQRHTDFYYEDLIGQKRRSAAPERALLHLPSGATPKLLPKGTALTAQLADGGKLRFQTEADVPVTPATVIATAALTYDTDPQVSLFSTLGCITGVRGAIEPAASQPLDRGVFMGRTEQDLDMGLDIASDMFGLAEGHRQIDVALHLQRATDLPAASTPIAPDPSHGPDPDIALELRSDPTLIRALGFNNLNAGVETLVAEVQRVAIARGCSASMDLIYEVIAQKTLTVSPLRLVLGRIVTLALVENHPWPTGSYWETLKTKIIACEAALTGQAPSAAATGDINQIVEAFAQENGQFVYSPADMFEKLLGDAFTVTLSTIDGPLPAKVTQILPLANGAAGLLVRMTYTRDMAPIVGDMRNAPKLSLRWDPQARFCPISFFERYTLEQVAIGVHVDGLTNLAGFSDDGPVATGQSFFPFGARPSDGASLTLASPEMARKPVSAVRLNLRWADVPDKPGGFATHYAAYPHGTQIPDPSVTVDYLSGDGWKPVIEKPRPLIDTSTYDGTLNPHWAMTADVSGGTAATGTMGDKPPKSRAQLRGGAIRLTTRGGSDFGQSQYPLALVDAMRPRRVPMRPRQAPNPPYVPKVETLSIGYTASRVLTLAAPDTALPGDKITQISPFGAREAFPGRIRRNLGLFPPRLGLGTLYIQLGGAGALRQLGILFDIADSGHLRLVPPPVALNWFYLTADGWTALPPTAIASDTTDGLLRSGVVTLDLPDDAQTPVGEMPGGGVWLAISAPWRGFETHPTLSRVRTNGVWAVSTMTDSPAGVGDRLWRFDVPQPGMATPIEAARRAPARPSETRVDYLARVSERLRHRQRAVTPFDVERLVLDAFPDVWRCKCLPHMSRVTPSPRPGAVTVVIVRHPPDFSAAQNPRAQERYFDVGTLEKVRAYLQRHGADAAQYEVVNPAFDRLHVRAAVRFVPFKDDGAMSSKLQQYLQQNLSVWTAPDDLARFGWSLNVPMLKAQIAAHPDVVDVTDFSVLHFVANDTGHYALTDTAQADGRGPLGAVIRPSRPWALPLSAADHSISASERSQPVLPSQSGIGRLRIGDMLIVGQEGHS